MRGACNGTFGGADGMWQLVREQFGDRRWLVVVVAVYAALTSVEAIRLSLFDHPAAGAAGVYDWELSAAVPGTQLRPAQRSEDGGTLGAPDPPVAVTAMPIAADRIRVSWNAGPESVQGFKLQRSPASGGWQTTWVKYHEIEWDFPAVPGSTSCFRVRSFNDAGHSLYAYPSPPCVVAAEPVPFRWTSDLARVVEAPRGAVLAVRMQSGRGADDGDVAVAIRADGEPVEEVALRGAEWRTFRYYLPILLPQRSWGGGEGDAGVRGAGEIGDVSSSPPHAAPAAAGGFAELHPWGRDASARPVRLDFEIPSTFVPAESSGSGEDRRQLGIRLAPLMWEQQVPAEGIGYHTWEEGAAGRRFRWTRIQASQPETPSGPIAVFALRADHPDLDAHPVTVRVFWNERQLEEIVLRDRAWTDVRIAVEGAAAGVLSVRVDRTWVPAVNGIGPDTRALGVAMTSVEWR